MAALILGLILFFVPHSVRIFADDWRTRLIESKGDLAWKGVYSLLSAAGFILIVWGYALARAEPTMLWVAPAGLRYLAIALTRPAFMKWLLRTSKWL